MRVQPWFIGLLSRTVVEKSIAGYGLAKEAQNFDREAYIRNLPPAVPASATGRISRQDVAIPAADGQHVNTARLYTPLASAAPGPLVVYVHGGGWVLNTPLIQPYDALCSRLSGDLGCCVLSLDYRLAPEHPWPAAVEDVYAALVWLASDDASSVAPEADRERIVLIGESAGGNLAACASLQVRDRRPAGVTIAHQVLCSPCVPIRPLMPSRTDAALADAPILPAWLMDWLEEAYAGAKGVERLSQEPYANPLAAEHLDGLPPLTGVVGDAEVLRDEGVAYFEAVAEAGGDAAWREYEGGFHAFVVFPFGDAGDAWNFVYDRLRATPGLFAAAGEASDETTAQPARPDAKAAARGEQAEPSEALLLSAQKLTRDVERKTFQTLARSPLVAAAGSLVVFALLAASVVSLMTGETFGSADYFERSLVDGIDASTSQRVLY